MTTSGGSAALRATLGAMMSLSAMGAVAPVVAGQVQAVGSAPGAAAPGAPPATAPAAVALPGEPAIGRVAPSAATALAVTWTAPVGSAVTGYVITPYVGITAMAPERVGDVTSAAVGGLTTGLAYSFTVAAVNQAGTGPASAMSVPVVAQEPTRVADVTIAPAPAVAGKASTYTVGFTTSPTGGLPEGGFIWIGAQPGTTMPASASSYTVTSTSGSAAVTAVAVSGPPGVTDSIAVLTLGRSAIAPGARVTVTIQNALSPKAPVSDAEVVVYTSADPALSAGAYSVVPS